MEDNLIINVAEDFSKKPGARYDYEGPNSGESFLKVHLLPKFLRAKELQTKLYINLDGVLGFPSSFVSGSFGKLSLSQGSENVLQIIDFISSNKIRVEKIINEIRNPTQK